MKLRSLIPLLALCLALALPALANAAGTTYGQDLQLQTDQDLPQLEPLTFQTLRAISLDIDVDQAPASQPQLEALQPSQPCALQDAASDQARQTLRLQAMAYWPDAYPASYHRHSRKAGAQRSQRSNQPEIVHRI